MTSANSREKSCYTVNRYMLGGVCIILKDNYTKLLRYIEGFIELVGMIAEFRSFVR